MTLRDQDLNSDQGEVGGSSPPRPTIPHKSQVVAASPLIR